MYEPILYLKPRGRGLNPDISDLSCGLDRQGHGPSVGPFFGRRRAVVKGFPKARILNPTTPFQKRPDTWKPFQAGLLLPAPHPQTVSP